MRFYALRDMKKYKSPILDSYYWVGIEPSPDGLPVFTQEEIEILKQSKDTLPKEMLEAIYRHKATFGGTLEEISAVLMEKDKPQESIGYIRDTRPINEPEKVNEAGMNICKDIIKQLKGHPKASQGSLF